MKQPTISTPGHYARVTGSPGETPRLIGLLRVLWPLFLIFAACGYLLRAAWPIPPLHPTAIGLLFLLLAGLSAGLLTRSRARLHDFLKGARGEESVARTLAFLPADYRIYHGLAPQRRGVLMDARDYDHIVVGPSGVFVVETKNWSGWITIQNGRILYDGEEPDRPPLDQVRKAASELQRRLKEESDLDVDVQPVLCFASGNLEGGYTGLSGVVICGVHDLLRVLQDSVDHALSKQVRVGVAKKLDQWVASTHDTP